MIVCYDPVAGDVVLHSEDGFPVFEAKSDRLVAKHYQDEGILVCEMHGEEVEIAYYPLDPPFPLLELVPTRPDRWALRLS